MQEDATEDHPRRGGLLVEIGEEGEADGPGGHAEDHDALGAEDRQQDRQQEEETDFGDLTEGHLGGVVGDVHLAQEGARPGEVEAQRDADQEGADHEDREGAVFEELEGIEAEQLAGRHGAGVALGRGVRQRERVERDGDGDTAGEGEHAVVVGEGGLCVRYDLEGSIIEDARSGVDSAGDPCGDFSPVVDHVGGGDPAGGSGGHDNREPLGRIRRVGEGDGVDEAVSGHVGQRVDDERRVEDAEGGLLGDPPEQAGTQEVQDAEEALGRDVAVGDHADEEGRDERADGGRTVGEADLGAGEFQLTEVHGHGVIPTAPHEVVEEDHDG